MSPARTRMKGEPQIFPGSSEADLKRTIRIKRYTRAPLSNQLKFFCELSTRAVPDTACRKTLVGQQVLEAIRNKCLTSSNRCLTSSNKKLLEFS